MRCGDFWGWLGVFFQGLLLFLQALPAALTPKERVLDLFCASPKSSGWGPVELLKYTSSVGKLPSFFIFTPTIIRGNHLDELRYSKQRKEKDRY